MSSNSEEDIYGPSLKELVTKNLEANGILGKLQAQLRASVFLILEEEFKEKQIPIVNPKSQELLSSPVGKLAVAIIQDFLQCLNLDFSLSVFSPESKSEVVEKSVNRETLNSGLGNSINSCNVKDLNYPFLFQLIETALQLQNQKSDNQIGLDKVPTLSNGVAESDTKEQAAEIQEVKATVDASYNTKELKSMKNIRNRNEAQRIEKNTPTEPNESTSECSDHTASESSSSSNQVSNPSKSNPANRNSENDVSNPYTRSNSTISDKETISGPEREYEDEFSSLSDLNVPQDQLNDQAVKDTDTSEGKERNSKEEAMINENETSNNEEKSEIDEIIEEEDLSVDDLLSSNSGISNQTRDLTASKETSLPDYEESV